MILHVFRRVSFRPHSYFLLPLRGVASPAGSYARGNLESAGMAPQKPPNVLIFTDEDVGSNQPRFHAVKETLSMCLSPDNYAIYPLSENQVKTTPWLTNTKLLIVACSEMSSTTRRIITEYFLRGGNILVMAAKLDLPGVRPLEHISGHQDIAKVTYDTAADIAVLRGDVVYQFDPGTRVKTLACDQDGTGLLFELRGRGSNGLALLSQIHLEFDPVFFSTSEDVFAKLKKANESRISMLRNILSTCFRLNCSISISHKLSTGNVFAADKAVLLDFLSRPQTTSGAFVDGGITFHYLTADNAASMAPTIDCLPVIIPSSDTFFSCPSFNSAIYFTALRTHSLGRLALFVENVTTTMAAIKALQSVHGSIAIATRQLNGVGRGGNAWLGPAGCAMFTVCLQLPLHSPLGQRSPFVQHLAALAMAKAVRSTQGYEMVNVRVKWPNDIYYGSHVKIGGVLVSSTVNKDAITCFIGCGLNVSNSQPTLCINDIAKVVSCKFNTQQVVCPLTPEEVIAKVLNEIEFLVATFQSGGSSMVLQEYYKYWLHGGQEVTLQDFGCKALIKGLDDYGYLLAECSGKLYKLQPDGNSFDLMNNLIVTKV
ncbi:biotin--protein ligase isoform X2 [Dermacentor albipictus]|uniref:biotin--protein ligase isoform X2 n=1 Tax=Dermacentor albipictus TaxID=60249 RepID=UPI0031FC17F1